MRFLLDHDIPDPVPHLLRYWGHEVVVLREVMDIGAPDDEVFAYVREKGFVVVTCNRNHFLALAGRETEHHGVIILIRRKTRQTECARLRRLLSVAGEAGITGNINFA